MHDNASSGQNEGQQHSSRGHEMTARTRWPQPIQRQQVKPKRRFDSPAGGTTFAELAAPGRLGMTAEVFWQRKRSKAK